MRRLALLALALAACDGGGTTPVDSGGGRMDSGPIGPIPCEADTDCTTYCPPSTGSGGRFCCQPADPPYDLCGDRIDQNCNRRDTSCGDNDRDGVSACMPTQDPIRDGCDCDDERSDVRPAFGVLPGAPEVCDGIDNDCNGRVDESAQCCSGCDSLGADRQRADICTVEGVCDCSTDDASGPCPAGLTCCAAGCVDVQNDIENCGFCNARCTVSSDRCVAGGCQCGDGPPCDLDNACSGGACPG